MLLLGFPLLTPNTLYCVELYIRWIGRYANMQPFQNNIQHDMYVVTYDDLVQMFAQSTNYKGFLCGGQFGKGHDNLELKL